MAFNIVELVKEQISDQLLGQMGNVLGTDGSQTSAALGGALPGLLAGLSGAADKPGGSDALFDVARHQDDGMLGNMGALLGGEDSSRVIEQGNSMLGSLLGGGALDKLGGVLASFAGISRSGSGSLMGMLAPIVIGAIKRKMSEGNLDAGGLSRMLGEQRSNIDAAMPQSLADQLRSEGFFDSIAPAAPSASAARDPAPSAAATPVTPVGTVPPTAATVPPTAQATGHVNEPVTAPASSGGLPSWLLPVAAVVLLALLAWSFLGGDDDDIDTVVTTEPVATPTGDVVAVELPEGVDLDRINGAVSEVVDNTASTLEGITDEASARAALPGLRDATTTLGGLSDVVSRLPAAAQTSLGAAVTSGLSTLQPLADRVLEMPGVGPVLEPVLRPMLETLQGLAG